MHGLRGARAGGIALLGLFCAGLPGAAQEPVTAPPSIGVPRSAVVVLDRDALFTSSRFGQRVARDVAAASSALVAENRKIETSLEAEEKALTARRAGMDAQAFREIASEFDARVTDIRAAQDAKARAVSQQGELAQQIFFERANPVLVELARETGALVILDRRMVIASADQVDITAVARTRIDAALGDGDAPPAISEPANAEDGSTPPD